MRDVSAVEINLRRLLVRSEQWNTHNALPEADIPRLKDAVDVLKSQLGSVWKLPHPLRPPATALSEYDERVRCLSLLLERNRPQSAKCSGQSEENAAIGYTSTPAIGASVPQSIIKRRQTHTQRTESDMRAELLGQSLPVNEKQMNIGADMKSNEAEAMLARERAMQEDLTNQMLSVARALKDTTKTAGDILLGDNRTLDAAGLLVDQNRLGLQKEHARLRKHLEVYGQCWVWLALLLAAAAFVFMIFFIRLFPVRNTL